MKSFIVSSLCIASIGVVSAASIVFNLDAPEGNHTASASSNDFGSGVTVSSATIPGNYRKFQNGRAELSVQNPTPNILQFTVTVDDTTTIDLSTLAFDYGYVNPVAPNDVTPFWNLSLTSGSADALSGGVGTVATGDTSFHASPESLNLSGLTNLTDTSVTFTYSFTTTEGRNNNSFNRIHTMDNIVLSGAVVPEPSSAALLGLGGLALLMRRRK